MIEIFEWVSQEAIAGAHSNPVVLGIWKRFEAVCDYEVPANIAEFRNMFAHFEMTILVLTKSPKRRLKSLVVYPGAYGT